MSEFTNGYPALPFTHHETFNDARVAGTVLGTVSESTIGPVAPTDQPGGIRTLDVAFAAGWTGGDVKVRGNSRNGTPIDETYPSTPGGTVVGEKAFLGVVSIEALSPAGAADLATLSLGPKIGTAVKADKMLVVTADGVETVFIYDAVNSTVQPTPPPDNDRDYDIWYLA